MLASLHESLEAEQARASRAEDEAVLLRARVVALEKASVVRGPGAHNSRRRSNAAPPHSVPTASRSSAA